MGSVRRKLRNALAVRTAFALVFLLVFPAQGLANDDLKDQLRQIRETWYSVAETTKPFSTKSTNRMSRGEASKPLEMATETTTERVLSVDGLAFDSRVYTFDAGPRKFDRHEVRLINERYSCTLSDKSDNNQFILSGQPTMHDQLPGFVRDGDNRLLCRLPWLVPTGTFCVPDLIDPEFTQVPKIEELGDGLLRVPFRVREGLPADKQERLRGMVAGALVLNRNKHYRLESAEIQLNQQSYTATLRFTYESPPREEFLLKGIEQDSKWSGVVPMAGRQVWEFECREVDDDPRRFYMSHYGLPEPVGVVPPTRPPPRYAWWLGGAAVFAVVALVARWAGKQRSRAGSDTPTPTG